VALDLVQIRFDLLKLDKLDVACRPELLDRGLRFCARDQANLELLRIVLGEGLGEHNDDHNRQ
jgi:hypothetical protein